MTQIKELIFEEEARQKLREGVAKLAEVAGVTLGPTGRLVGLEESSGSPTTTRDGFAAVQNLAFKDPFVNMGAAFAKEAAARMKYLCSDGTTTTLILLRSLVDQAVKNINAGASPIDIKQGMEKGIKAVLKELSRMAKPTDNLKELLPIAISSASGSREVGTLVAEAIQKVGPGGIVTIEEGKKLETFIEMTPGMHLDCGYLSPYFCTHPLSAELHDAAVLITDMKIDSIQEIILLLQNNTGKELIILADEIQGDALSTLVMNKLRGTLKVCAIKAPGFGDERRALLQDLSALTGATVISHEVGLSLKGARKDVLGVVQKVVVTKEGTTFIGGIKDEVALQKRIQLIEAELLKTSSRERREKLLKRKAHLLGGVVIIYVGGATESEMKHPKQLFEDSLNASRAAVEEGVVPGGGIALLKAARSIQKPPLKDSELTGFNIALKACAAPFRQIVQNTGHDSSLFIEKVLSHGEAWGFNALAKQVENLVEQGIVDPCKVTRNSLQIALETASTILLSEVLIGYSPVKKI